MEYPQIIPISIFALAKVPFNGCECLHRWWSGYLVLRNFDLQIERRQKKLMAMNEKRRWLGMLGSANCMHWTWKNFPKAWYGQFCSKSHDHVIVLAVKASHDLWFWPFFDCRDHSMISMSWIDPLYLLNLLPRMLWLATTKSVDMTTQWATILPMESICLVQDLWRPFQIQKQRIKMSFQRQKKHIKRTLKEHSVSRKFGLPLFMDRLVFGTKNTQQRHDMLCYSSQYDHRGWEDLNLELFYDNVGSRVNTHRNPVCTQAFLDTYHQIENSATHTQLNNDLIEYHWQPHGEKWLPHSFLCIPMYSCVRWTFICTLNNSLFVLLFDWNYWCNFNDYYVVVLFI
jgi:hypothetical protein